MNVPKNVSELETDRILFVNMKSGDIFFDCHPAEARAAVKQIKEIRNGNLSLDLKEEIARVNYMVHHDDSENEVSPSPEDWSPPSALNLMFVNQTFAQQEKHNHIVEYIVMSPQVYGDVRGWGKCIYDEATVSEIEHGLFAFLFTSKILVDKDLKGFDYCTIALRKHILVHDDEAKMSTSRYVELETPCIQKYSIKNFKKA